MRRIMAENGSSGPHRLSLLFFGVSSLLFLVPELNKLKKLSHEIQNPGEQP